MNAPKTPSKAGHLCVGVIRAAHGLKGEVLIKTFTAEPLNLTAYGTPVTQAGQAFPLSQLRLHKGDVIALPKNVPDRTTAERLVGTALFVPAEALPDLAEGEFYLDAAIGWPVEQQNGQPFGTCVRVFDNGAHPVVVVEVGGKEVLLPLAEDFIRVDTTQQKFIVTEAAQDFVNL